MRIAYFVSQYPAASHSFIRREIMALEARGHHLSRYALTSPTEAVVDPEDRTEAQKTRQMLSEPLGRLLAGLLNTVISYPFGLCRALRLVLRIGPGSDRGLLRHFAYLAEAAIVVHWCRRERIEHLHSHFGTNPAAVALLAHTIAGLSYSFTVHGPDEFDKPEAIALGVKIRHAAFVVAVSSFGRSQLMRWAEISDWPKLKLVHCGLTAEFRAPPVRRETDVPSIVCIGRLAPQKGHLILLAAAHKLLEEGFRFRLILAGDGPLRPHIERHAAELGLMPHLTITGWISGKQVIAELARACAMVLPSVAEGLPVAIMEAMALRRPVISTFIAGIPELVIPGVTGWLVPAGDVDALVDAMRELLNSDPARLAEMGEAAHRRVFERHTMEREAAKLEALLLERHA
ncbi:Glycosyltransferase family 4 protein [Rhodovastum atsumiense]|uniref:Glycosyltransferase family 4 protein n=1 Tax=Rhodovastum atsumiense TaxID=504468 RepID=A0A5M6J318_9PROT|nr:glycosyltransferase family 4 protein [Rhodovastum atsumiense]KAA5614045.1 glycosyltransferase family 4 protein [Rhodovastum atsumiense]CAH2598858.1 Glycosyltransferase family 4 protein [Rhodovastum atsumiense]